MFSKNDKSGFSETRVKFSFWVAPKLICDQEVSDLTPEQCYHTGQCKRTGGCYNELVVAFYSTGGGVKGKKIYTC